jgi:hypothetical protein
MREKSLPALPHQLVALQRAGMAPEAIKKGAEQDLASAFDREPHLMHEAAQGQTQNALRAMRTEAQVRTDPSLRADRFVANWRALERERSRFMRSGDQTGLEAVQRRMSAVARYLERDPQMESVLRNRRAELGLQGPLGRGVGDALLAQLGFGQQRSRSPSRGVEI